MDSIAGTENTSGSTSPGPTIGTFSIRANMRVKPDARRAVTSTHPILGSARIVTIAFPTIQVFSVKASGEFLWATGFMTISSSIELAGRGSALAYV
jgi:hypothetical protein